MQTEPEDELLRLFEELTTALHNQIQTEHPARPRATFGLVVARVDAYRYIMRPREQGHDLPHYHVEYQEYKASFGLDPIERIAGHLPSGCERVVLRWAERNVELLKTRWNSTRPTEFEI